MKWLPAILNNKLIVYIMAVAICLLGLFCLTVIPISPFPNIAGKMIDIDLSYPGANAAAVQTQVTAKVVEALQSVNNIQQISANSSGGSAHIHLVLDSIDTEQLLTTQIDIMQAISSSHLPSSVPQPMIRHAAGRSGLIVFTVSSDKLPLFDIDNFIQSTLYPKLKSFPGVSVDAADQQPVVKIQLIPEKLARYQLSAADVSQRIDNNYQSIPLGGLYLNQVLYPLSLKDQVNSLRAFGDMVVGTQRKIGIPIYLKDIAHISFQPLRIVSNYYSSFNGHVSDAINLFTSSRANPFMVSTQAKDYVATLQKSLPQWIKITPVFDMAKIMRTSIREVMFTIGIASLLVLLIALMFLGHLRTTIIPIITIPICLLGSIIFVNALGFSVNILTLLAMVIAVGLVVDDAIVVVENITRHLEQGMSKYNAVLHGTADIALTVLGITATLLAVYLPIAFASGDLITFLKNFAVPLAAAVFISGILALTLTPVMCVTFITDSAPNAYQKAFSTILKSIIDGYQAALKRVIRMPKTALLIVVLLIAIGAYFASKLPQTMFPSDPSGSVKIQIVSTSQDTVATLRTKAQLFKPFYHGNKVEYYSLDIRDDPRTGKLTGRVSIQYKPRYLHQNVHFTEQINAFIKKNKIQNTQASIDKFLNAGDAPDLSFDIYGGSQTHKINQAAIKLTALMKTSSLFTLVTNGINFPQKQIEFDIDTAKAARVGLFKQQISNLLSTYYGGYTLNNHFNIAGLSVPVMVLLGNNDLQDPHSIQKLQIVSQATGKSYPMSEFVSLKTVAKPVMISTFNNQSSVEIDATLKKGHSLSEAIPFVNVLMSHDLPQLHRQYTDKAQQYLESSHQTILVMILGIFSVYFILTILFRSVLDPFIILLTVPFSVIGGALSLYLVGGSLNLFSILGLVTLVGLITKHGVLIVQFANQALHNGASVQEAIITATHHRFRPIIMTTLAMAFGALPLVLSQELMYVSRQALGVVIIGGLLIGTFFSLFIVPLVYTLVKKQQH